MRLVLTGQQEDLRTAVRDFLADQAGPARVREVLETADGFDRELWRRAGSELGVLGLVVAEEHGGAGAGHVERSVVAEELGATLVPSPFLASAVLAVDVLNAVDDIGMRERYLPPLAAGELIGTVAHGAEAAERDGGWRLDGRLAPVISGDVADVVLVHASTPDGTGWFALDTTASGVRRTTLRTLDPTRRLARIDLAGARATRLDAADPDAVRSTADDLAAVALAAEQVGGMRRVLEMTTGYAEVRVQFGRRIGSYQGVKHALADLYGSWEQAVSVLRHAAWAADEAPDELPVAAAVAQVFCAPAAFRAAADGVVLHGGIGYTWEHDAHLYYKRAKTSEVLFGSERDRRLRLADLLGV
ncbi:acyl-CoA/acyl-ACP dehydrogenase [Saccharopolyspora sp. NFXS83]|uniref:acyl-CoA dehydrogenase family protein n=1 Tax=Saccharopolyspora sp. NFXS83 TaxID=2993560 RepID=UPI00224AE88E|nr:acyl-CoA dehydrogenase family protein [Saccharopolyspora sp. NFXS83]MCX2730344.1 acyl-CoA/acyl-ACP dehydrogenase [Saccharopolyspora sp. NFXS83]